MQNFPHRWECKTNESYLLPSLQPFSIFFPRKLNTERVVLHLMQARIASSHQKEELSEKQGLTKWHWRHFSLYLLKKGKKKTRKVFVLDRNSLGIATTFHTQSQVHNNAGKWQGSFLATNSLIIVQLAWSERLNFLLQLSRWPLHLTHGWFRQA